MSVLICPVCDGSMDAGDYREYGHCYACRLVEWDEPRFPRGTLTVDESNVTKATGNEVASQIVEEVDQ